MSIPSSYRRTAAALRLLTSTALTAKREWKTTLAAAMIGVLYLAGIYSRSGNSFLNLEQLMARYTKILFLLILLFLVLSACGGGDGGDDNETGDGSIPTPSGPVFSIGATTDRNGEGTVNFVVPENVSKFSVTLESDSPFVFYSVARNSEGKNYLDPGGAILSLGTFASAKVNTINIPSRAADGALSSETYTVSAIATKSDQVLRPDAGKQLNFTIETSTDSNFNSGNLLVNVFLVGALAQEGNSQQVVQTALQEMKRIFAEQGGIGVVDAVRPISGPTLLPPPDQGSSFYESAAAGVISPAVNIFVGTDISGLEGVALGFASSIPGPPSPTQKSVVAVSLLTSAGADGVFSANEARILGETMAHESGHYLGLLHPVEISRGVVVSEDALSDTATCNTLVDCIDDFSLKSNLMFPTPLTDGNGGFVPQNLLTTEQRGVLNRYTAVN